jgi:sulfur transfer protein SufE
MKNKKKEYKIVVDNGREFIVYAETRMDAYMKLAKCIEDIWYSEVKITEVKYD